MARKRKSLVKDGEPLQRTEQGLEIPVPTRGEFFANMEKVAKADERPAKTKRRSRLLNVGEDRYAPMGHPITGVPVDTEGYLDVQRLAGFATKLATKIGGPLTIA